MKSSAQAVLRNEKYWPLVIWLFSINLEDPRNRKQIN